MLEGKEEAERNWFTIQKAEESLIELSVLTTKRKGGREKKIVTI